MDQPNATSNERRVKLTVMVTPQTKTRLKELGKLENRSLSCYSETVLAHHVGRRKTRRDP